MKAEEILRKLSLEEKIALTSGADFWNTKDLNRYGLSAMKMSDGPNGLRCQKENADNLGINESVPATCFPTSSLTACSFDPELMQKIGQAVAEEAKENHVGIVLGPGVCLKRDPLCGRNFEYFSEDPCLSGEMGAGFIKGVEETGIGSSLKHFACNNQEYKRFNGNDHIDERTMRELYLAGFETAVKKGHPSTVMCAYNKINGVHCSDSKELLTDILRKEWGFEGMVVTDWGAVNDRVKAIQAGCDLSMPGGSDYMEEDIREALNNGTLSMQDLDACALRILKQMERTQNTFKEISSCDCGAHHAVAKQAVLESAVLLKNEHHVLPLKESETVAVIGRMAGFPRYQGSGSSHINPVHLTDAYTAMKPEYYADGYEADGTTTDALLKEAAEAAGKADKAVVFAGLPDAYESEGFDRKDMKMPEGHNRLIEAVVKANPDTIVVLCTGGVVETPWADAVPAVLWLGLAGEAGGEAVNDLLKEVSPSGRLGETWPFRYEDVPTSGYYRNCKNPQYREGLYVGYRYYDKSGMDARWKFGYGLGYWSCALENLKADEHHVSVDVINPTEYEFSTVLEVFVKAPQDGIHRPLKELKRFAKVSLKSREKKAVSFDLDERCFAVWSDGWKVPSGMYGILVTDGGEQQLETSVEVKGVTVPVPAWQKNSWYESPEGSPSMEQWEAMSGKFIPDPEPVKGSYGWDDTCLEMKDHSFIMKCIYEGTKKTFQKQYGKDVSEDDPVYRMLMASSTDSSFRNMYISSASKGGTFPGLLDMANGHFFRGLRKMMKKTTGK